MGRIIGIDLGTTNCCVAWLENDKINILPMADGAKTMPSVVSFDGDEIVVGKAAKRQATVKPETTIFGAKRLIGRKYKDPKIRRWERQVPYNIVDGERGDAWIEVGGKKYGPEQISALLLGELKRRAEDYLGEVVQSAVITVPAYFNERQRQATKDAGTIAGLNVEHIINEPTAAALGYGATNKGDETLAVFDLGGGTFDITILKQNGDLYEVLATHGDTFLGGEDFDQTVIDYLADNFEKSAGIDLRRDPVAKQRLKDAAEEAKHALSAEQETPINLPFLTQKDGNPLHLNMESFSRRDLQVLCANVIKDLEKPCFAALQSAGLLPEDVDRILLAGGMTRMPAVQDKVEEIFKRKAEHHLDPDHIVAIGAAVQCGIMQGDVESVTLLDVTPHSIGLRVVDGRFRDRMRVVIPKNSSIPVSEDRSFTTTVDMQDAVRIEVFQGESDDVRDNVCLGAFLLTDLPEVQAGTIEITVSFLVDADGLLQVTAREATTGQEATIEVQTVSGLSPQEVNALRMQTEEANKRKAS
jgi:molecular chaperone DnaK